MENELWYREIIEAYEEYRENENGQRYRYRGVGNIVT